MNPVLFYYYYYCCYYYSLSLSLCLCVCLSLFLLSLTHTYTHTDTHTCTCTHAFLTLVPSATLPSAFLILHCPISFDALSHGFCQGVLCLASGLITPHEACCLQNHCLFMLPVLETRWLSFKTKRPGAPVAVLRVDSVKRCALASALTASGLVASL